MLSATAARPPGRCPSCKGQGSVGEACTERVCTIREYCFIPDDAVEADPQLGQKCGEYLLIGVLGSGGFGRVYHALQLPLGMPAAVKLLDMEGGPAGMAAIKTAKFDIEAQALARLSHPNIVRLYQYGTHRGAPYLAMELIEGSRNLWAEIEGRAIELRPFALDEVQAILMQVLAALEAAHERQIVHRDIKPENVMLQSVPGHGLFVKVLDFGLAKFTEDRTATSMLLGTPAYMAPEQLLRGPIGPWTDLYALGVLAFELLTGKRPYGGGNVQETLALKLDPAYDPWSRVANASFPEELRIFMAHALARETEARYANAGEMRAGLERVIAALRDAGELYRAVPVGRLVESTVIPPVPLSPQPEGVPLPDPTRRLARPASDRPQEAPPDGEPLVVAGAPVEVAEAVPSRIDDVPSAASTAPTGTIPPPRTAVVTSKPSRGWVVAVALLLAAGALGVWFATRTEDSAVAAETPVVTTRASRVLEPESPPSGDETPEPAPEANTQAASAGITPPLVPEPVEVAPAMFARGSAPHDPEHQPDEDLQEVVLTKKLVAGATEVTQSQWAAQFSTRPSRHARCGPGCPVDSVSWWDAAAFANALSDREGRQRCYTLRGCKGLPGDGEHACSDARFVGLECTGWRLPTEAEWEFLARAQSVPAGLATSAWTNVDAPRQVATKDKNAFGLFDMVGNVREWVHDAYGPYPAINRVRDPLGGGGEGDRVIRGGGYRSPPSMLRAAARDHGSLSSRSPDLGFRLVRSTR